MKKIIIVVFAILAAYIGVSYFPTLAKGDSEGGITIILIDENQEIVSEKSFTFESEISLYEFMKTNYELGCANKSYQVDDTCSHTMLNNHIILSIDEVATNWSSSYLQIIVDETPSEFGIDLVMLKDNTTYTFKYVDLGGGS